MLVRFNFEFDFDVEGYDKEFIDIKGLAKDSALRELKDLLKNNQITEDDFEIVEEKYTGKVQLTNKQRMPLALSNNFDDTFGLTDSIKECNSAEDFCRITNKFHNYGGVWSIDKDEKTNTRLIYTDRLGNVNYLIAIKE